MIVCKSKQYLFFQAPKTGCTSIQNRLELYLNHEDIITANYNHGDINPILNISAHTTPLQFKNICHSSIWNTYRKYSSVRNPWDRVVSAYWWWRKDQPQNLTELPDFSVIKLDFYNNFAFFSNCWTHTNDYYFENNQCIMDFIIKYESLQKDFDHLSDLIGIEKSILPLINNHTRLVSNHYREYYNSETKLKIESIYSKQIEYFMYSF